MILKTVTHPFTSGKKLDVSMYKHTQSSKRTKNFDKKCREFSLHLQYFP